MASTISERLSPDETLISPPPGAAVGGHPMDAPSDTENEATDHTTENETSSLAPSARSTPGVDKVEVTNPPNPETPTHEAAATNEFLSDLEHPPRSNSDSEVASASESGPESGSDSEAESVTETEPPLLKYTRLTKLPPTFFHQDPVSAVCIHERVCIFATHSGVLHLCRPDFTPLRTFRAHRASILAIHTDGEFFATGSMDGTVVIGSLVDDRDISAYDFKRPIHAVALVENYTKERMFLSGGKSGHVTLSTRNWLGQRHDTTLNSEAGDITGIYTTQDLVVWTNDQGVTLYSLALKKPLCRIPKPAEIGRAGLYWPRVAFPEKDQVLIAWESFVWMLRLEVRHRETSGLDALSILSSVSAKAKVAGVTLEHTLRIDSMIAGICSFKNDLLMLLTYTPGAEAPELRLINPDGGAVLEEEIGLRLKAKLGLNDYHLQQSTGRFESYYVISAHDGVVAEELTLKDRVDWYIEAGMLATAWELGEFVMPRDQRHALGVSHVEALIGAGQWSQAAAFMHRAFDPLYSSIKGSIKSDEGGATGRGGTQGALTWEAYLDRFHAAGQLAVLAAAVPLSVKLLERFYNTVLLDLLRKGDASLFIRFLNQWDGYGLRVVEDAMEEYLEGSDNVYLREALAQMYIDSFEASRAVPHLLALRRADTLLVLGRHSLLLANIALLPVILSMNLPVPCPVDHEPLWESVSLLVEHSHEVAPEAVVAVLKEANEPMLTFCYLKALRSAANEAATAFEDELIRLYLQYEPKELLSVLTTATHYDMDAAITVCEEAHQIPELVYLLGKVGQTRKALMLIINELDDAEYAIAFTRAQHDRALWDYLIAYSVDKPVFIRALIELSNDYSENEGSSDHHIDPVDIISRIPEGVEIDGLRASICKISSNNELSLLIHQKVAAIINAQNKRVGLSFWSLKSRGFEIDPATTHAFDRLETVVKYFASEALVSESEFLGGVPLYEGSGRSLKQKGAHLLYLAKNQSDLSKAQK